LGLSFSQRDFTDLATKLRNVKKQSSRQFLLQHGRLFARDCVRGTPPFGAATYTESYNVQRKAGELATHRDISNLFQLFKPLKIADSLAGTVQQKQGFAGKLRKYARRGDVAALTRIVSNLHYPARGVILAVDPELHQKARNSRGRIKKGVLPWLVLRVNSIKQYIAKEVSHVGKAKAGWVTPAAALGLQLPAWITRHADSPGLWLDQTRDPTTPGVTIGNLLPWAQQFEDEFGIVEAALENRRRSMQTSLNKIIEHNKGKAGL
jgi:hypothetical protein